MTVRVEPAGARIEVGRDETLMGAAVRAGYRWPSICGGLAECGACVMELLVFATADLPPVTRREHERLQTVPECRLRPDATLRLACQFRPGDIDVTVQKRGVRLAS